MQLLRSRPAEPLFVIPDNSRYLVVSAVRFPDKGQMYEVSPELVNWCEFKDLYMEAPWSEKRAALKSRSDPGLDLNCKVFVLMQSRENGASTTRNSKRILQIEDKPSSSRGQHSAPAPSDRIGEVKRRMTSKQQQLLADGTHGVESPTGRSSSSPSITDTSPTAVSDGDSTLRVLPRRFAVAPADRELQRTGDAAPDTASGEEPHDGDGFMAAIAEVESVYQPAVP